MSVILKKDSWKIKDPNTGEYRDSAVFSTFLPEEATSVIADATAAITAQETRAAGIIADATAAITAQETRAAGIISDAQDDVDIIAAAVASMAQTGTDTTLNISGAAADAKVVGDKFEEQSEVIGELKDAIEGNGNLVLDKSDARNAYPSKTIGSVVSFTNSTATISYNKIIQVTQGQEYTISVTNSASPASVNSRDCVIIDDNNIVRETFALSTTANTTNVVRFTPTTNGWLVLAVDKYYVNLTITGYSLQKVLDDLKGKLGYSDIVINRTTGKYVNADGGLSNGSAYAYTETGIPVKGGDTVTFIGRGYSTSVAMIYTCDSDGSNRSPVVMSIDASQHNYSATFFEDCYVGFSWHTAITPSAYKVSHELAAYTTSLLQSNYFDGSFELGNINVSSGNATWVASSNRVRTTPSLTLRVGDIIGLSNYTNARYFYVYYDGTTYKASAWLTKDFTITKDGSYYVVIGNLTDTDQNGDITALANLFRVKQLFSATQLIDHSNSLASSNSIRGLGHPMFVNVKNPILAHRGLSGEAPENTIPAFELAGKANLWGIEADLFQISDGTFVCFHDATVNRMTDGTGNIADMTWEQVQALTIDAGSNIEDYPNLKIPKFEDYLKVCKLYGCVAVIDLHYIPSVSNISNMASIIKKCGMESMCVCAYGSSVYFNTHYRQLPSTPAVYTVFSTDNVTNKLKNAEYFNVGVLIESTALSAEIVEQVHGRNAPVMTFTADSKNTALEYMAIGADIIESNSLTSLRS